MQQQIVYFTIWFDVLPFGVLGGAKCYLNLSFSCSLQQIVDIRNVPFLH